MDKSDETWRDGAEVPAVEPGNCTEFIVAVERARNGKVYSFAASYLNAYPLTYNDGCPQGKDGFCDGCEDGCPTTGWFSDTGAEDEGRQYHSLSLADGDKFLGWRNIPQWQA